MAINVRNEHTLAALRQLSQMTGRTMAAELDAAVTDRLHRLQQADADHLDRLRDICRDAAQRWPDHARHGDPTAPLYDDRGLPV